MSAGADQARGTGIGHTAAGGVGGMDQRRTPSRTLGQDRRIVHPTVVRAQIAASDHHQVGSGRREIRLGMLQILEKQGGRELDLSRGGSQNFGHAGLQRAEVDAVSRSLDLLQRQAVRAPSELVAVRTAAQREIEQRRRGARHLFLGWLSHQGLARWEPSVGTRCIAAELSDRSPHKRVAYLSAIVVLTRRRKERSLI